MLGLKKSAPIAHQQQIKHTKGNRAIFLRLFNSLKVDPMALRPQLSQGLPLSYTHYVTVKVILNQQPAFAKLYHNLELARTFKDILRLPRGIYSFLKRKPKLVGSDVHEEQALTALLSKCF